MPRFLPEPVLRPELTSRMALEDSAPGRSCLLAKTRRVAPARRWRREMEGYVGSEGSLATSPDPPGHLESATWRMRARAPCGGSGPSGVGSVDNGSEASTRRAEGVLGRAGALVLVQSPPSGHLAAAVVLDCSIR